MADARVHPLRRVQVKVGNTAEQAQAELATRRWLRAQGRFLGATRFFSGMCFGILICVPFLSWATVAERWFIAVWMLVGWTALAYLGNRDARDVLEGAD